MSNPPSQDEPGLFEPPASVFARLTDVPLDVVDKLIETTNAVYGDLNKVQGHPYWGDLVYHQGAAMRALREARECLEGLRAEAVGARNTELGITVATAVVDGERHYAHSEDDKANLVNKVLRPSGPGAGHFFVWDRPFDNDEVAGPFQQIRVVTDPEAEVGVLNYTEETEDGELLSWHTFNPQPLPEAPPLRFDAGSALRFPRNSVLRFRDLRAALVEFARGGQRPGAVEWQTARWGEA
ncbi:Imm1 family immunity protein [Saccharopolyspora taberi]|uniref:Immunity protein Imm1 n=1 Tax=Saccharopolyspora taberi TaxID=60895 RepID=A0ABN3VI44_9PSEU